MIQPAACQPCSSFHVDSGRRFVDVAANSRRSANVLSAAIAFVDDAVHSPLMPTAVREWSIRVFLSSLIPRESARLRNSVADKGRAGGSNMTVAFGSLR